MSGAVALMLVAGAARGGSTFYFVLPPLLLYAGDLFVRLTHRDQHSRVVGVKVSSAAAAAPGCGRRRPEIVLGDEGEQGRLRRAGPAGAAVRMPRAGAAATGRFKPQSSSTDFVQRGARRPTGP